LRTRQPDRERRAAARGALELDRTAELLDEPSDDVETKTRAAEAAGVRLIGLSEHLEDRPVVLRADADARVGHG